MDGATPGSTTCLPQGIRIWLDDPNPIFRMGLAASLRDPRFVVVGESSGFVPTPALENVDVLVFDLGDQESIGLDLTARMPVLGRRRRTRTRLVGLVPGGDVETAQRSQCTILLRSELTPEGFRDCLASVASQALPPAPAPAIRARNRLRRIVQSKGALFVVVVALAAGAFGPSGRAEGLSESTEAVTAAAETTPVESGGDAAGDVAVWVNSADPAASLVLGTDKQGALESYDLAGRRVQRVAVRPAGTVSTVDVRNGFSLGGKTVALVATGGRAMSFFRLDPSGRQLREVTARDLPTRGPDAGVCLYRSPVSGRFYAFVTEPRGDVTQYELADRGGYVDAREVRSFPLERAAKWCVTDDETGRLFVSEADSGVWRYNAEPDASPVDRRQVDRVGGEHLASVAGLAVVTQPGRQGYLLASSPGDNSFAIYQRGHDHGWVGRREVVDGAEADGCSGTTGIEAVATGLGPEFPSGLFVCQDGRNTAPDPAGPQNFKYVRLERLLDAAGPAS